MVLAVRRRRTTACTQAAIAAICRVSPHTGRHEPRPDRNHRRSAVRCGAGAYLLDQAVRPPRARPARSRQALASAGRGGDRVRPLGHRPGRRDDGPARQAGGRHLCRRPQLHRALVRVRHHGGGRLQARTRRRAAASAGLCPPAAAAHAGGALFHRAGADPAAGFADHRAGGDDAGRADAARPLFLRPHFGATALRHPRRAVRQRLHRRRAHALCRPAGVDGGRRLGLGPGVHAHDLRRPRGAGGADQCGGGDGAVLPRTGRHHAARR